MSRREALGLWAAVGGLPHGAGRSAVPAHWSQFGSSTAQSSLCITGMDVFVVRATPQIRWSIIRLRANGGLRWSASMRDF